VHEAHLASPTSGRTDGSLSTGERRALASFADVVRSTRYDAVLRLHSWEQAPRRLEAFLAETLESTPRPTRDLVALFALRRAVPAKGIEELFGSDVVACCERLGVLRREGVDLRANFCLEVAGDTLLFVDGRDEVRSRVYFGEDSRFLRSVLAPREGEQALDLCAGSGVQALRLAERAAGVDAVDLDPEACRLARLNAVLNGLDGRVVVHRGDLWDALPPGRTFDHVVSNPPLVPVPEDVVYPLCGHGGADGLTVTRRILAPLPERLNPGGRAAVIGASTGDECAPFLAAELEQGLVGDLQSDLFVMYKVRLRDWTSLIAQTVKLLYDEVSLANTVVRARTCYGAEFDRTWVYTWLLLVDRQGGPAVHRVFDYASTNQKSFWYVHRGKL
jgi:SAM-dependent methyltransferase